MWLFIERAAPRMLFLQSKFYNFAANYFFQGH